MIGRQSTTYQLANHGGIRKSRHGFTLIELLVVIAIISLLASILLPSLNRAKELAKQCCCQSNLRGIMLATTMYVSEHRRYPAPYVGSTNGYVLIDGFYFPKALDPYIQNWGIWVCPSNPDSQEPHHNPGNGEFWQTHSYAINQSQFLDQPTKGICEATASQIQDPTRTIAFSGGYTCFVGMRTNPECLYGSYDPDATAPDPGQGRPFDETTRIVKRHNWGCNYAFCDGHSEWMKNTIYAYWSLVAD